MAKDYGNLGMAGERKWENPCDDFLEMKRDPELGDKKGVGEHRYNALKRVIRNGPKDDSWKSWDEFVPDWKERGDPSSDENLTTKDGEQYYNHLLNAGISKNTVLTNHIGIVQHFLDECMKRGVVDANPAAYVIDQADTPEFKKNYPEITVSELGNFLKWIPDPQKRAGYTIMVKTAIRIGETVNIDLPYLHLNHPIYYDYIETRGIELHEDVREYPDSVLIPPEPEKHKEFRGEVRLFGNKTKDAKRLPIDRETRRVLLDWLVMRPNTGYPYPLFTGDRPTGRAHGGTFLHDLKSYLREYGLAVDYVKNDNKNIDLHYFRHFFSTNMQDGRGTYDGAKWTWSRVKIIRGDIGGGPGSDDDSDGLQRTYTHDWGDLIREPYINDIYNFGIYK